MKELEEQKKQREMELEQELNHIKMNLEQHMQQAEQERLKAEQLLNEQMEEQRKLTDEEKTKREHLVSLFFMIHLVFYLKHVFMLAVNFIRIIPKLLKYRLMYKIHVYK